MSIPFVPLYINGSESAASSKASFEVHNPYSGDVVTHVASASSDDSRKAVEAAALAFRDWENSPLSVRRQYFLRAAELLGTPKYQAKVASAIKEETSATDYLVGFNLYVSTAICKHLATVGTQLQGETFESTSGGQVIAQRRAQGVVFAVPSWNLPLVLTFRAAGYPIICGNTVVLKSPEVSPRCIHIVAEIFEEAGFPKGVLNVIHTSREDAPARVAEIIAHPAVKKVNFTGSDRVGKIIAAEAAKYLKPCVLELGNKAPAIVLADADVARAAKAITSSALLFSGQTCMATQRVIVQQAVAADLTKALVDEFSKIKSGGPREPLGALFSEGSAENVVSMIHEAQADGARLLVGDGQRIGSVVQPHIVTGVKPGMRLWERESFGPVIVLSEVDTVDEAVELANNSEYSLTSSLWTKDVHAAVEVSRRVRAGSVNVNGPTVHLESGKDHTGLGGASGYGRFSVDNFTDVRMIIVHPSNPGPYPLV